MKVVSFNLTTESCTTTSLMTTRNLCAIMKQFSYQKYYFLYLSFTDMYLPFDKVYLSFSCVDLLFNCAYLSFDYVDLSFNCVDLPFNCVYLSFNYVLMSVYRSRYYAFLFFIQLWLVAIQLFNIDPILIDGLYLSPQKHCWTADNRWTHKVSKNGVESEPRWGRRSG